MRVSFAVSQEHPYAAENDANFMEATLHSALRRSSFGPSPYGSPHSTLAQSPVSSPYGDEDNALVFREDDDMNGYDVNVMCAGSIDDIEMIDHADMEQDEGVLSPNQPLVLAADSPMTPSGEIDDFDEEMYEECETSFDSDDDYPHIWTLPDELLLVTLSMLPVTDLSNACQVYKTQLCTH